MGLSAEQLDRARSLMACFCGREEVAAELGTSVGELERAVAEAEGLGSYDEAEARWSAAGRARLHRAQFEAALDGDRSMLLALGREYLGQGDPSPAKPAGEKREATVLALVQDEFRDAPDRKSRAAH